MLAAPRPSQVLTSGSGYLGQKAKHI
uniref:Uncharacterized protein n=1 Tax=Anopheles funestus TaxID=62324 RepID=A0A182S082_ANOFN